MSTCGTCGYFDITARGNCSAPVPMTVASILEHAADSVFPVFDHTEADGCDCYVESVEHVCSETCNCLKHLKKNER